MLGRTVNIAPVTPRLNPVLGREIGRDGIVPYMADTDPGFDSRSVCASSACSTVRSCFYASNAKSSGCTRTRSVAM